MFVFGLNLERINATRETDCDAGRLGELGSRCLRDMAKYINTLGAPLCV